MSRCQLIPLEKFVYIWVKMVAEQVRAGVLERLSWLGAGSHDIYVLNICLLLRSYASLYQSSSVNLE